jgi:cation:H+ antiporter
MLLDLGYVAVGLVGLFLGGNFLVKGSARLASAVGISPLIVGLTVVALGTSAPELLVALSAALQGSTDIAVGNVVGSNIANIGFILALSAIIVPISLDWHILRRELPAMLGFSALALLLSLDGEIGRLDGLVFVLCFAVFTTLIYRQAQRERREIEPELIQYETREMLIQKDKPLVEVGRTLLGLVLLVVGAQFLVVGAVNVARDFGVSELIIGITLVAVGTSLPELATCVIASRRRENDIVVGNIIGSNISNVLVILGVVALLQPIPVSMELITFEMPVMIAFAALLLPLALRQRMGRGIGILILGAYAGFILLALVR